MEKTSCSIAIFWVRESFRAFQIKCDQGSTSRTRIKHPRSSLKFAALNATMMSLISEAQNLGAFGADRNVDVLGLGRGRLADGRRQQQEERQTGQGWGIF